MAGSAPTLWDNTAMESGFHFLAELDFGKAETAFSKALMSTSGNEKFLSTGLAACHYWGSRIKGFLTAAHQDADNLADNLILLQQYQAYSFSQLKTFGTNLLKVLECGLRERLLKRIEIHSLAESPMTAIERELWTLLVDLLLSNPQLKRNAPDLLETLTFYYPADPAIHFLRAESNYRCREIKLARRLYASCMLQYPGQINQSGFIPEEIRTLLQSYGDYMAPVYGTIQGILPEIHIKAEIPPVNEQHQLALDSYRYYQLAESALKKEDLKTATQYRKKLFNTNQHICREYLACIKQREGRLN